MVGFGCFPARERHAHGEGRGTMVGTGGGSSLGDRPRRPRLKRPGARGPLRPRGSAMCTAPGRCRRPTTQRSGDRPDCRSDRLPDCLSSSFSASCPLFRPSVPPRRWPSYSVFSKYPYDFIPTPPRFHAASESLDINQYSTGSRSGFFKEWRDLVTIHRSHLRMSSKPELY